MEPVGGDAAEADQHGLAPGGAVLHRFGFADRFAAMAISQDQAGFGRRRIDGEVRRHGDVMEVAKLKIFPPFAIGREILRPALALDNGDGAGMAASPGARIR